MEYGRTSFGDFAIGYNVKFPKWFRLKKEFSRFCRKPFSICMVYYKNPSGIQQ